MSEMSEKARAASKDKAERMTRSDPHARVDASGYAPEGALDGDVQTGPRPVSRRQFRRGGKVDGVAAAPRADRKQRSTGGVAPSKPAQDLARSAMRMSSKRGVDPYNSHPDQKRAYDTLWKLKGGRPERASGGPLTANSYLNRNVKAANEDRAGTKHVGGMKSGGRAEAMRERVHKLIGGALTPAQKIGMRPARASGGGVHEDAAQDRKLIHKEVHEMGCKCERCGGGRVKRAEGGKLTANARKHIKAKNFAGPDRSYPIEDESHARNALARVAQHGSPELQKEVRAKVHAKYPGIGKKSGGSVSRGAINDGTRPTGGRLARKGGGRAKKGTNVNIIIAPQGAGAGAPPVRPLPMPTPGAAPMPMAAPAPVGLHQGAPPVMPASPGVGMPMRAAGGRTYPIDAGAGSGLGRLEKAERASRS